MNKSQQKRRLQNKANNKRNAYNIQPTQIIDVILICILNGKPPVNNLILKLSASYGSLCEKRIMSVVVMCLLYD